MNTTGKTYYYIALKANTTGVATGSFAGNTSDNRDITTTFQPEFVGIKGGSITNLMGYRFASNSGDESFCGVAASAVNIIQNFAALAFQVGTDSCSNENAVTMRWFALADVAATASRRRMAPIIFQ